MPSKKRGRPAREPQSSTPNAQPRPARWPLGLALLYLVLVVGLAAAGHGIAERRWWSTLLLYPPQVLYAVPAPLVLLPALWKRDRRALAVLGVTLALIAGPLMGLNVPLAGVPTRPRGRVRVLEYNIQGGLEGFDRLEAQVQRFQPDVVVFSEARGWGHTEEIVARLRRLLPGWQSARGGDIYIASRWPLAERKAEWLGPTAERGHRPESSAYDRAKLRVLVDAPFGQFHVVGAHFRTALYGNTLAAYKQDIPRYMHQTSRVRAEQADDLVGWLGGLDGPVILAGDFNTPPAGNVYGRLTQGLVDSFRERGWGWGYTYPSRLPLLRIDYVFHSREWAAVSCRVGDRPGSDHRPVFAELALK
jgi:vancomycin resistance protein VanJ